MFMNLGSFFLLINLKISGNTVKYPDTLEILGIIGFFFAKFVNSRQYWGIR